MEIKTLKDLKYAYQNKYTNIGGYPLFMIMNDGGSLCIDCVRSEYRNIVDSLKNGVHDGWLPAVIDVNYESYDVCDHCGKEIETAYGAYNHPKYCNCEGACKECRKIETEENENTMYYCNLHECKLDTDTNDNRPLKCSDCEY